MDPDFECQLSKGIYTLYANMLGLYMPNHAMLVAVYMTIVGNF